ncbi:potassium channel family protein [Chloroflexota bacterium]
MKTNTRGFRLLVSLPVIVLVIGTTGFMILERLPFVDALYFTIVTISTVGYGDLHPTTMASKLFSMVIIIIGIGIFLTIVTNVTQMLIQRGQDRLRRQRLNMLIGVFFTEVGNQLLHLFVQYDPNISGIRKNFLVNENWSENDFTHLKKQLKHHDYAISPELMDLEKLRDFLREKGDLLVRQIENQDLIEHESFTELLWAVVHLRDELMARESLVKLPETDVAHLANDAKRAYIFLVRQWGDYLQYLKNQYPYLFSLALRTNPFIENSSAVVE